MELRHLRYFLAVADCKGFVKASEVLHIAQPALSRQIRELETELGVTLFERSRKGTTLTISGACFLQDIRPIFESLEQAKTRIRRMQSGYTGTLSIGMVESFAWHEGITLALRNFQEQCPEIVLNVSLTSSPEQLREIRDERLDAGLLFNRPEDDDTYDGIEVLTTRAVLAVPENSPYAKRPPKRLAELNDQNFIFLQRTQNPHYYDQLIHACHEAGLTPRVVQSGASDSSNLSLVASGLGMTFVPEATESRKPKSVVLVPVQDMTVTTKLELVWRRGNQLPALKNLVRIFEEDRSARRAQL